MSLYMYTHVVNFPLYFFYSKYETRLLNMLRMMVDIKVFRRILMIQKMKQMRRVVSSLNDATVIIFYFNK